MFNLGIGELLIILAAIIVVFGPKRIPEVARGLGRSLRGFKDALSGGADKKKEKDDTRDV